MKTKSMTRFLLSICLMLVFSIAPIQVSSMDIQSPDQPRGANGDGYADLAIGIPYRDYETTNGAGMVGVVYGSQYSRLDYDNGQTFDLSTSGLIGEPGLNNYFGQALAGGDFNRDGYLDLAIGVPGKGYGTATNTGTVTILYGSSSGFSGSNSQLLDQLLFGTNTAEQGDRFGAALASGDFNRDGYDDLAIGVPGQDVITIESAGVVDVAYGTPSGLSADEWSAVIQGFGIQELPEESDNFGSVLAAGDFDGDGYHDLVIGTPKEELVVDSSTINDAGVVQIVYGSADGISIDGDDLLYQGHDGLQDEPDDYDKFGSSLAVGDFDGNGRDDLAIGVPNEYYFAADAGIVHILWGDFYGITTDNDLRLDQALIAGQSRQENDHFGWALAAGNFNGDDDDDLAIGVPGQDVSGSDQAGAVHVLYGSFSSFASAFTKNNTIPLALDQFGFTLAAGDFDGNNYADLVVSIPYYDRSAEATNSGVVLTMYSDQDGVDGSYLELGEIDLFNDGSLPPQQGDLFGFALAVLDEPHSKLKFIYLPLISK